MQLFFFLKFTQRVTILQTVSNQEVTLKRLISMLRIAQTLYVGALSDLYLNAKVSQPFNICIFFSMVHDRILI